MHRLMTAKPPIIASATSSHQGQGAASGRGRRWRRRGTWLLCRRVGVGRVAPTLPALVGVFGGLDDAAQELLPGDADLFGAAF